MSYLDVVATASTDSLFLLVINRHFTDNITARLSVEGLNPEVGFHHS